MHAELFISGIIEAYLLDNWIHPSHRHNHRLHRNANATGYGKIVLKLNINCKLGITFVQVYGFDRSRKKMLERLMNFVCNGF